MRRAIALGDARVSRAACVEAALALEARGDVAKAQKFYNKAKDALGMTRLLCREGTPEGFENAAAIVVEAPLLRMQARRVLPHYGVFAERGPALEWLLSDRPAAPE